VVYPYAEKNLSQEHLDEIDIKSKEIEDGVTEREDYSEHLKFLDNLSQM